MTFLTRPSMHLSPSGRWLTVDRDDDSFELVDVLLVTSVEKLPHNGSKPDDAAAGV